MWRAKESTLNFSIMYLTPLTSKVYLLVTLFFKVICYLYSSVDCFHICREQRGGPVGV